MAAAGADRRWLSAGAPDAAGAAARRRADETATAAAAIAGATADAAMASADGPSSSGGVVNEESRPTDDNQNELVYARVAASCEPSEAPVYMVTLEAGSGQALQVWTCGVVSCTPY